MSAPSDQFPRRRLAHLPTPLEPLPTLSTELGIDPLWIKRDDCTGFALGGNKVRKLEFLMADAEMAGATAVVTAGGTQSNHVRQTVAAATKLGLSAHCVLERVKTHDLYENGGNAFLDRLFGASLYPIDVGTDVDAAMADIAADLSARGETPYIVPVGGSNPLGCMGYVECAWEMAAQFRELGLHPGLIIHASGSAGTQAGLLVGLALAGLEIAVMGMCVSRGGDAQRAKVAMLVDEVCALLGRPDLSEVIEVHCDGAYVGPGYGEPTAEMSSAVTLAARTEGLVLDPVYTGKAMAGLIDYANSGKLEGIGPVVFLHTGGSPALFVYRDDIAI